MVEQRVDQRAVEIARRRMHDQPGRLVDDDQMLVLIGDRRAGYPAPRFGDVVPDRVSAQRRKVTPRLRLGRRVAHRAAVAASTAPSSDQRLEPLARHGDSRQRRSRARDRDAGSSLAAIRIAALAMRWQSPGNASALARCRATRSGEIHRTPLASRRPAQEERWRAGRRLRLGATSRPVTTVRSQRHAAFGRRIRGRDMAGDGIEFASLLCSRLCHDLLSPVGALNNGIELLADEHDPEMRARCLDLLAESARASANKLKFFRLAFGAAGGFGDSGRYARGPRRDRGAVRRRPAHPGRLDGRRRDARQGRDQDPAQPRADRAATRWSAAAGSTSAPRNGTGDSRSSCAPKGRASCSIPNCAPR